MGESWGEQRGGGGGGRTYFFSAVAPRALRRTLSGSVGARVGKEGREREREGRGGGSVPSSTRVRALPTRRTREQRVLETLLSLPRQLRLGRVVGQAVDGEPGVDDLLVDVAEPAGLGRAAGGVGLGVGEDDEAVVVGSGGLVGARMGKSGEEGMGGRVVSSSSPSRRRWLVRHPCTRVV